MRRLDDSILAYLKYVGDFCSIGGLVAAYVAQGKTGLVALLSRTIRFRVPAAWWLLTLLIPFSYVSLAFLLGGQVVQSTGPLDLGKFWGIFSVPALAAFLTGPIGEELGWRGFLVPELFKKHSLLVSSVMTGVLWGLWHYPLYYDGIFASLNIALLFIAGTIATSILMSIIFMICF